jgi:hypothetical protein
MKHYPASLVIASLITITLSGCRSKPAAQQPAPGSVIGHPDSTWRAPPPLDTAILLQQLLLIDSGRTSSSNDLSDGWDPKEDTIVVRYTAYACTCPDHDLEDTLKFDGIKAFYLEAADGCPSIPWRAQVTGNRFELIGHRSLDRKLPEESTGPPEAGYFFQFRSYRILRPYVLWGPEVWEPPSSGDSGMWTPTLLEVR